MIMGRGQMTTVPARAGAVAASSLRKEKMPTSVGMTRESSKASESQPTRPQRGTFIVLEGVDRCGKTTQCGLLLRHLLSLSVAAVALRFPDRTTAVGHLIDSYLKSSGQLVDDRAVHLLFSANRWEAASNLANKLSDGHTVICDRYAYSGVAFSSAKETTSPSITKNSETAPTMSVEWCKGPDVGLPAPDAVIFLDLPQDEAEMRGGYGDERYEKRDLQIRVRKRFAELQSMDEKDGRIPWHIVDASGSIEEVQAMIAKIVFDTIGNVQNGKPLCKMWEEGEFPLQEGSKEMS